MTATIPICMWSRTRHTRGNAHSDTHMTATVHAYIATRAAETRTAIRACISPCAAAANAYRHARRPRMHIAMSAHTRMHIAMRGGRACSTTPVRASSSTAAVAASVRSAAAAAQAGAAAGARGPAAPARMLPRARCSGPPTAPGIGGGRGAAGWTSAGATSTRRCPARAPSAASDSRSSAGALPGCAASRATPTMPPSAPSCQRERRCACGVFGYARGTRAGARACLQHGQERGDVQRVVRPRMRAQARQKRSHGRVSRPPAGVPARMGICMCPMGGARTGVRGCPTGGAYGECTSQRARAHGDMHMNGAPFAHRAYKLPGGAFAFASIAVDSAGWRATGSGSACS